VYDGIEQDLIRGCIYLTVLLVVVVLLFIYMFLLVEHSVLILRVVANKFN
jgi:hypothetical protein